MIIELPEYHQILSLSGFRNANTSSPKDLLHTLRQALDNSPLQILDATYIAGKSHVLFATVNALNAFQQRNNLSAHIEVEILLYLSAQRQISKAIELIGVNITTRDLAVIFLTSNQAEARLKEEILQRVISGQRDDSIINFNENKRPYLMQAFNISRLQLQASAKQGFEALEALIIEQSAMLAVSK